MQNLRMILLPRIFMPGAKLPAMPAKIAQTCYVGGGGGGAAVADVGSQDNDS